MANASKRRLFENRKTAAEELAANLEFMRAEKPIVLGLMNGGVIVAEIVAAHLDAPLDVMLIEKLMAPKGPGHVVGVVDEHGRISMIESTARWHHLTSQQMVEPARAVFESLQKRRARIRALLPELDIMNRTVVLVDEGVDTGARMLGAIASVRDRGAGRIAVAAPAGASRATWQLRDKADVVVIPHRPNKFAGVDHFYDSFPPISDETILALIERHVAERGTQHGAEARTIHLPLKNSHGIDLSCDLDLPSGLAASDGHVPAVVFAHGFESNALSPRNLAISRRLTKRGLVGIRMDFTGHGRSGGKIDQATDEQMLDDLTCVFRRVVTLNEIDHRRLALVGSGTGALIALRFAAHEPLLGALVLRGPILGDERELAARIRTPTLIIHAEGDTALAEGVGILDRHLLAPHQCVRIANSNRLFNDPISLELMINASVEWLCDHLKFAASGQLPTPPPAPASPPPPDGAETTGDDESSPIAGSGEAGITADRGSGDSDDFDDFDDEV
jgi:putative phosphoribosyl transferase